MNGPRERILEYIKSYIQEHGYPPCTREICDGAELKSTSSVNHHVHIMLDRGILETDAEFGVPRALRVPGYKFIKE